MAKTTSPQGNTRLLDFDLGACVFELLLERFGISLGNAFLDGLRSAIDQILGDLPADADTPIVTKIEPGAPFYAAEDYHQQFYLKHPDRYAAEEAGGRAQFIKEHWGK